MSEKKHVETTATKKPSFDEDENTPLHYAAARGLCKEVIIEVENGHKIDIENYVGWTPLMMATKNGHLEIVKFLISKRADATRKNSFGGSTFLTAVASGNLDIVHIILEHLLCGGISKQSMESTFSPLSIAVLFNNENVFKYLLEKSFTANAIAYTTKLTPLMFASLNENPNFALTLQSKGANPNLQNISGNTAQDLVRYKRGAPRSFKEPLLMIPTQVPQVIIFNPHGPGFSGPYLAQNNNFIRKSSNTITPNYICSPAISPVTPLNYAQNQLFFPQDFGLDQYGYSPIFGYSGNFSQGTIMSPVINMPYNNLHSDNYIVNIGTPILDTRLPPEA